MRSAILYLILLGVVVAFLHSFTFSPCDSPIKYQLGTIDKRFNITQTQLLDDISLSAKVWENEEGKKLFVYTPDSKDALTINLIYDERQALNNQISTLEDQLDTQKISLTPKVDNYEQQAAEFKRRVEALNQQIDYWNSKGGAPADIFAQLKQEQQDLKDEADTLNKQAQTLNQSANTYNAQVNKLNQTVSNFNLVIKEKPEEGLYRGKDNAIDIYFNTSQSELTHTLSHELGHALGLSHVENKEAIMYPYTSKTNELTDDDTKGLTEVCRKRSLWEIVTTRLFGAYQQIQLFNS